MARKVLLVESDDSIATALEFVLAREGLECQRLANGRAVLPGLVSFDPDLVVLDGALADVSGFEICREMRRDPALGRVRVLMMTARGSAAEQRRAMKLGADGVVPKPFELAELRAELARLMG